MTLHPRESAVRPVAQPLPVPEPVLIDMLPGADHDRGEATLRARRGATVLLYTVHPQLLERADPETIRRFAESDLDRWDAAMATLGTPATDPPTPREQQLLDEYVKLWHAAQAVFDAAGNGPDALGEELIKLGLLLAGSEEPSDERDGQG